MYPGKTKPRFCFSTMHNDNKIDEDSGLPIITLDYNANKAAVDRVDQLCHNYNVQKRTKLRPLAYSFNCLNIAGINSMVIFRAKLPQREKSQLSTPNIFRKFRLEFASFTATATSASQATSKRY